MKAILNSVKVEAPNSNSFDLTHDVKFSGKMGYLYPVLVMEMLPGDKIHIGCETLIRFMPLIAPVMHRMDVTVHYFFVPNRLVWENWEKFITNGGDAPLPQAVPAHPYYEFTTIGQSGPGTLSNYMGIPDNTTNINVKFNAIPFAGYRKIINDYYRDENLETNVGFALADGNNTFAFGANDVIARAWEHDYFTSALPFAQKGAAVQIPVRNSDALVKVNQFPTVDTDASWSATFNPVTGPLGVAAGVGESTIIGLPQNYLYAQLNGTVEGTMQDLRTAMKLQEWLEKNARGGTRYTEHLRMHWNVTSSDARLQRAEYITGSRSPVIVSEVLNTTGEDGGLPQGNQAGHAISADRGRQGSFYVEEHGFIMGLCSVMPKTAYFQGLHKMWQRFDPTEYAWPSFAHIGEQAIINNEVFIDHSDPLGVFGYIPRYSEYKVAYSRIAGELQTSLKYWHLGRIFQTGVNEPDLNNDFIKADDVRTDIFAVQDDSDYLVCHILHKLHVNRKLPVFGTPTF